MELVKNQQAHAFECRVVLQTAGQDAFGDDFNTGIGPYFTVQSNPIAHGFADLFAQFTGQTLCRRPGCQTPGFQHHNLLPGEPRLVQQGERHPRGFTGAGRGFKHRFMAFTQGLTQRR